MAKWRKTCLPIPLWTSITLKHLNEKGNFWDTPVHLSWRCACATASRPLRECACACSLFHSQLHTSAGGACYCGCGCCYMLVIIAHWLQRQLHLARYQFCIYDLMVFPFVRDSCVLVALRRRVVAHWTAINNPIHIEHMNKHTQKRFVIWHWCWFSFGLRSRHRCRLSLIFFYYCCWH